ncbi:MAG: hypothetical protein M1814_005491 [Vezdaea aestivalis]|nr:MAG: hypothetical protein M1814_005491 [Vezdaea aestivalis]
MAFTPGQGLKITPSNSPYYRPSTAKLPGKPLRSSNDPTLSLRKIIGTTVSSANGFACLSDRRRFAYTAGAAAVVVDVDENNNTTQRFFRARPTAVPLSSTSNSFVPSTPTPIDSRHRTLSSLRDAGVGMSPGGNASPLADWGDSPSSKTWTARERIKAATCLSFSPDGKYLAVGETGYSPRVLLFSLAADAPCDIPVAVLSEHTFGIRSICFSPDSKYLASLGTMNDGFLHVWTVGTRIGAVRLHSSNKCTSFVRQMTWMGSNIITVGTRHVKVWRIDDKVPNSPSKPKPINELTSTPQGSSMSPMIKSLTGRNCLLGPLADAIFTCVTSIAKNKAIACTDKGDICLVDDSNGLQRLNKIADSGFPLNCVTQALDSQHVIVGGRHGRTKNITISRVASPETPPESPTPPASGICSPSLNSSGTLVAIGKLGSQFITIDSHHQIRLSKSKSPGDCSELFEADLELHAHRDSVRGVKTMPASSRKGLDFYTWSSGGSVMFWGLDGCLQDKMTVELEQPCLSEDDLPNELKVVQASLDGIFFVSGDKYGVLRVIDGVSKECVYEIKAHGSEITDIALHQKDDLTLVASCARDRTVQLFRRKPSGWELVQTMDEHQGSVSRLLFAKNGEKLLSASSDRSVVVREFVSKDVDDDLIMAFLPTRTITLKATPVSITMQPDQEDTIIISTMDRHVHRFDIRSGRNLQSFKATDSESNDAVVLDALVTCQGDVPVKGGVLAAISTTDKSIRTYNNLGVCIDKDFGHTEGVTDMVLLGPNEDGRVDSDATTLISTGSDGTIMIWSILPKVYTELLDSPQFTEEVTPVKETTAAQKPLRRVLSRSELAEFQRPPEADPDISTPSGRTSPPRSLRRKTSRYSLAQSPRLGIPPLSAFSASANTSPIPSPAAGTTNRRLSSRDRSPSPPSPKRVPATLASSRRPSLDARSRTKSATNVSEFGSLNMSTEQVCRTLRAYRKKLLNAARESLRVEGLRELERELGLTAKAVREQGPVRKRSLGAQEISEAEKLADMIDETAVWTIGDGKSRSGSESPGEKTTENLSTSSL